MPDYFKPNQPFRGLWISGGKDSAPVGAVRRGRGLHRVFNGTLRSRNGSTLANALDAHSVFRYNSKRYAGVTTVLNEDGSSIKTGLDGTRLTFTRMPPTTEKQDHLFVSGGGDLFKVSPSGGGSAVWGIVAPLSTITAAAGSPKNVRTTEFKWTASASGTDEFYLEAAAGGDPLLQGPPTEVRENASAMTKAIAGTLSAGEFDFDDNDSLGLSTIYVRLTATGDPDAQADGFVDAVFLSVGNLKYKVTFLNSSTGHRSNGSGTAASITLAAKGNVNLSSIPTSSDTQVTARELWRTVNDGAAFFLLDTINDNVTTIYTDETEDGTLSAIELPTDNDPPDDTFEDCVGPFDSRMWWTRDTAAGDEGKVYFSPVGRAEAVDGFLEVSNPDDPMQKLIIWNGLWGFSKKKIYRILGGAIPLFIETEGVVGTSLPDTVKATPFGIVYEADDGIRLFNGRESRLLFPDAIAQLFQNDVGENLAAMVGVVAEYAREEYLISDQSQTIAANLRDGTWRDIGLGIKAFHFEEDTGKLQASSGGNVLLLEEETATDDNGTAIPYAVEFPAEVVGIAEEGLQQILYLDIDPNGQIITPTLVFDGTVTTLATITGTGRQVIEIPQMTKGRLQGIRLTGSLTARVTVYRVTSDVAVAQVTS